MALARHWRQSKQVSGPHPIRISDVPALNDVFSEAFTDRYRKDGLVAVRVPRLNPAIWRFAIDDAAGGAMLWRGDRDEVVAFNVAHISGVEGWMGPLAVRPDYQGQGAGKAVVITGVEWLKKQSARVVGLETMPRTIDNVGFYSSLGFVPGHLTVTITIEAASSDRAPVTLGQLAEYDKDDAIRECRQFVQSLQPGYDFSREILLTDELALGDTVILRDGSAMTGFALCHTVPLVEGRVRDELRVLKAAARTVRDFGMLVTQLTDLARRGGIRRVAIRLQGEYSDLYRLLIGRGGRVRWTDLRMCIPDFSERRPPEGVVLSNWEI
jgi:GNAT superfamily N-acetyltransferase